MIYRVSVGNLVDVLLDDELEERPTPEVARDYIRACSDEALRLYLATPDPIEATPGSADEA